MDRVNFYDQQLVSDADCDSAFDKVEAADRAAMADLLFTGVTAGLTVAEHSPTNLTVVVDSGTCYDADGQRIRVPSAQTISLATDHTGTTTAVSGGSNSKIVSVFLKFDRALSQPETDGTGTTIYYVRDESYAFYVKQGAEALSPTPPSLEADGVLLADVTLIHGQTAITDSDISIDRRQDLVVLTGTPLGTEGTGGRYGSYLAAIQAIVDRYNDHVDGSGDVHPATQITYAGSGNWANADAGDAIGVTNVEVAIDSIPSKLGATTASHSGAHLLGVAQLVGTYTTISAGTLHQVLTSLRSAANLEYATTSPVWANADNADKIAAQALKGAIDSIVTKLAATTSSHSGLHLIGGATCGNFTSGTAYSFFSQLTQTTSSDDGAKRIGAEAVGNFTGTTVRAQLTELTATTSSNDGAKRIGAEARSGTVYSLSSGDVGSQLAALLAAVNALAAKGSKAWGRFSTNGSGAISVVDHEGISTGSVAVSSTYITVVFSTPFADANYAPILSSNDSSTNRQYKANIIDASTMRVWAIDPVANTTVDPSANLCSFSLDVKGRQ